MMLYNGLKNPNYQSHQIRDSESMKGLWRSAILMVLASCLVFGMSAYFGVGSEYLSKKLTSISGAEYEMHKSLFVAGQVLWGMFYGAGILFVPALFFWSLTDTGLDKFLYIQFLVLAILLLEKTAEMILAVTLGLPEISSPFSLGVLGQYITGNSFIVYFLASITIFKIWAMFVQYTYIKVLTDKSRGAVLGMVIGLNVALWLLSSLFSIIQFEKLV
ncbi:hypothetical protein [Mesobacillus zeae]|uniref:Yip1 domain-containing protein n=1 Tax=Mesobacillus zeae TaxID=1917180 RepID=A0A398AY89_9BACI|nr:hypothetical protein [Mesobacillus zeae]RID82639.1 hypothetical protein D1970_18050 [Mesobacillus zeae]